MTTCDLTKSQLGASGCYGSELAGIGSAVPAMDNTVIGSYRQVINTDAGVGHKTLEKTFQKLQTLRW